MSALVPEPRIAPGGLREVGLRCWAFSHASGWVMGTVGPPNLFLTLGRHRKLLLGWLRFARRLMPGGRLPRRETELVILRVAQLTGSQSVRGHHLRMGRRAGVTADEIDRLAGQTCGQRWSARELAILSAVDSLLSEHDLDDTTWARLRGQLDEQECIELCMLVGNYAMLSATLNALRVRPDLLRQPDRPEPAHQFAHHG